MLSLANLIVILVIILLLFGAGRIPQIMADLAKGLKVFKQTMQEDKSDKNNDTEQK